MSKFRPPTTKQDYQPRFSMGFFPGHTCQTFRGEHVSKSRRRLPVQLLARHMTLTTGSIAIVHTMGALCPSSSQHMRHWWCLSASTPGLPLTRYWPFYSRKLPATVPAFFPWPIRRKVPNATPFLQSAKLGCHVSCPQSWTCMRSSAAWGRVWGRARPRPGSSTATSTSLSLNIFIYKKGTKPSLLSS